MYNWRKMTTLQQEEALRIRKGERRPWHAPPHFEYEGRVRFIITAACFEHRHIIGSSPTRLAECERSLIEICQSGNERLFAWCVLPNHYHLLVETEDIRPLLTAIGRFHGSSSYRWNKEDGVPGRKTWYRCVERSMRSERHFFASLNYIHNNPVKHGYVERWRDWPFSSAVEYLKIVGEERAAEIWKKYPVLDYGKDWDRD